MLRGFTRWGASALALGGAAGLYSASTPALSDSSGNRARLRALGRRVTEIEQDLELNKHALGEPSGRTAWSHPVLQPGRVAVVTGASTGIGLAICKRCASLGMNVVMADVDAAELEVARQEVAQLATKAGNGEEGGVIAMRTDVRNYDEVARLSEATFALHKEVALLVNNAGIGGGAGCLSGDLGRWRDVVDTNLWGVVNGVQAFAPRMAQSGAPGAIVNTGSKQGMTTPPGDTAYNVSKAGVKVLTEGLEHELRNTDGCRVHAYLLVPGWTNTSIAVKAQKRLGTFDANRPPFSESNPAAGAWSPDKVAARMFDAVEDEGPFYIICPDNEMSNARFYGCVEWAAGDVLHGRPPLSRWTQQHAEAFKAAVPAK